jgi:hypothetical protein
MKKCAAFFIVLLMGLYLPGSSRKVETITLNDPIDFSDLLIKNNVFFKFCRSFDWEDGYFYFLDTQLGTVFKVDDKTGKLHKTIGSRGQGPGQLQQATAVRVLNKKVYILDNGFGGFKVFNTEGILVKEVKLTVPLKKEVLDVNANGEIFLGRFDIKKNTLINVYDFSGKKLRSIAPLPNPSKVATNKISQYWNYQARLDKKNNLYLLFNAHRKLAKYSPKGDLVWEIDVKNKILDTALSDDGIVRNPGGSITTTSYIMDFHITPEDDIIIGHYKGGCIYSPNGKLKKLLTLDSGKNISIVRVFGDRLVHMRFRGEPVDIYSFNIK